MPYDNWKGNLCRKRHSSAYCKFIYTGYGFSQTPKKVLEILLVKPLELFISYEEIQTKEKTLFVYRKIHNDHFTAHLRQKYQYWAVNENSTNICRESFKINKYVPRKYLKRNAGPELVFKTKMQRQGKVYQTERERIL